MKYEEYLKGFILELKKENSRFKSWEYCFSLFNEKHKTIRKESRNLTDSELDYLCLNLAFYLASWGMYRGSSFLIERDYKIHKQIINILFEEQYDNLWDMQIDDYSSENINKIIDLKYNLEEEYSAIRKNVKNKEIKTSSSLTLITKVIMGTLGCVPAYDTFFIESIRKENIQGTLNFKSINSLVDLYKKNPILEKYRKELNYPPMKIIDMVFWQIGYINKK